MTHPVFNSTGLDELAARTGYALSYLLAVKEGRDPANPKFKRLVSLALGRDESELFTRIPVTRLRVITHPVSGDEWAVEERDGVIHRAAPIVPELDLGGSRRERASMALDSWSEAETLADGEWLDSNLKGASGE
jgi:hypothetical protein